MPTRYNDGRPVEPERYLITRREIAAQFGVLTFLPQPIYGEWTHQATRYEDANVRIVVDVEDTPGNAEFFAQLKPKLKERFQQLELWIVSYEIRII